MQRSRAHSTTGDGAATAGASKCRTPSAHQDLPVPGLGRPTFAAVCCSSGTIRRATRQPRSCRSPRFPRLTVTRGPSGVGAASLSKAPTAARSSTTSSTWRTFSTFTTGSPRTSRTSSRATSRRSTYARGPSRRQAGRFALHRRTNPGLRGVLFRPVLHGQLAAQQLRRVQGGVDSDQLPLPGHTEFLHAAVGNQRAETTRV